MMQLKEYFRKNLISAVYPRASFLERFLTASRVEGQIIIKFLFKELAIDLGNFPVVDKKAAIVGTGMIARLVHIPALISLGVDIKYLVDVDKRRAEEAAKLCGAKTIDNVRELQNIDYVVICTPPQYHPSLARDVMEMGFDCFIEKPIALTIQEAESMIETARKTKKKLLVGHMRHWDPQYEEIKGLAKTGNYKILRKCFQSAPLWRGKQCQDSILEDGVVHDLDLLRVWLGDPMRFRVVTRKKDYFICHLQFDSGEAEIDDSWVGTYTKLPLALELTCQIIGKTFYNKIWEARSSDGKTVYHYHEKDRMPLVAYQGEHYELLSSDELRYKPEDALKTMRLVGALQKAPLNQWFEYKKPRF